MVSAIHRRTGRREAGVLIWLPNPAVSPPTVPKRMENQQLCCRRSAHTHTHTHKYTKRNAPQPTMRTRAKLPSHLSFALSKGSDFFFALIFHPHSSSLLLLLLLLLLLFRPRRGSGLFFFSLLLPFSLRFPFKLSFRTVRRGRKHNATV